jgi:hypothetical protein
MKSNLPMALNKAEILSEMESLVVLGGKDDGKGDSYSVFSQCKPETNSYCGDANCGFCSNCVENCGGKTPTPGSTLITGELIP